VLPEITLEYFWDDFRDHEHKLNRVHAFAAFMQPEHVGAVAEYAKKVVGLSRSEATLKERSLYLDYRHGKILLPSEIGEMAARKRIKVVRAALAHAEVAFSVDSLSDLLANAGPFFGSLKNAMIADPDATAAALEEAMRGGSQAELQALAQSHAAIRDD
jgi:hypothetical protein